MNDSNEILYVYRPSLQYVEAERLSLCRVGSIEFDPKWNGSSLSVLCSRWRVISVFSNTQIKSVCRKISSYTLTWQNNWQMKTKKKNMLLLLCSNVVVLDCGGKMHIFFLFLKNELKNTLTVRCTRIQCMIVYNFALMSVETCFRFNSFFTNFFRCCCCCLFLVLVSPVRTCRCLLNHFPLIIISFWFP